MPTHKIKGNSTPYPSLTLHDLLAEQAKKFPNSCALNYENKDISYLELQERINKMANYLKHEGIVSGKIVTISLERTPELIVCIFAVLQCGASYIPVDTSFPEKRIENIINVSCSDFVISYQDKKPKNCNAKVITIENAVKNSTSYPSTKLNLGVNNHSPAYIIYTSGSTGTPKGVEVTHKNVVNLVYSMGIKPGINHNDRVFAVTTISFDAMVMEIFLPLLHGACIVLVNEETRRDGRLLLQKASNDKITIIWGTPSIWQILLDSDWKDALKIKALIGGEAVPKPLANKLLDKCDELWNIYGPTETTVCAFLTRITIADDPITIGTPVNNTYAYLLDNNLKPVKEGEIGEIVIGGDGVSLGYLNQPELTKEKFIPDTIDGTSKNLMYRSGDLGKLLKNGHVQCLGRIDHQVKVRGHRIELGEVEAVISAVPSIKKACVVLDKLPNNENRLVAYLQGETNTNDTNALRKDISKILPDYMVPSIFMWVDEFPITTNGKIDKNKLPAPEYIRPDSAPMYKRPSTTLEKGLASIWSENLHIDNIGINDNFFELGGTSLLTQKTVTIIRERLGIEIPVTKMYQYPTIAELSKYIEKENNQNEQILQKNPDTPIRDTQKDVAVVGMAGRFPGAESIEALWDILREGKETISFFKKEDLDDSIPSSLKNDTSYVSARGVIPTANTFDAAFFGLNPKLAEAMDPQLRLFLEIAWEALEQSMHLPKHFKGSIGVYAGTGTNTYFKNNVLPNTSVLEQVGILQANTVNDKDYVASRTAYHLNLKGPAVSVHTACSTSLVAIAEAVEAIRNGKCDVALAGGASVTAPINSGHLYQEGAMLSPDGHCRSFDANAKGTVFSDGAGVLLLKRLSDAQRDNDHIYGVIKGVGVNNDGGDKGSFTAPSIEGQSNAIKSALEDAKVAPATITYLEAHGTATPLGDPIEIEGLHTAFGKQNTKHYCAIGSIKSNMGHLTAAAGVTGVIKTMLALKNKQIPASLGFEKLNPVINLDESPFYVNTKLSEWVVNGGEKRRAGISSFGVGGTNAHIIVEEYDAPNKITDHGREIQLLTWSAKSENSLSSYAEKLSTFITNNQSTKLADIAYSLQKTRDSFKYRKFAIAKTHEQALTNISALSVQNTSVLKSLPSELVFLFPGQGAQYLQMGKALYDNEIVFKTAVDDCSDILKKHIGLDIRDIIFPSENTADAEEKLKDTKYTQPALFVIEYAMAKLWMDWGVKPTAFCGHSIGEFVGAHLAGVFSLVDALHLIATRGRLVSELPYGSMLSIRLSKEEIYAIMPKNLSLAAVNSDTLCVASGFHSDIEHFAALLKQKDIPHKLLFTSHAFHSTMMDPVLDTFKDEVTKVQLTPPKTPIISTVTGTWLTNENATDPNYWTNHLRDTVQFSDALDTILKLEDSILLEVGPGKALTTLALQKKSAKSVSVLSSLPMPKTGENAYHEVINTFGKLWLNGIEPDWTCFYKEQSRKLVHLPSYAFDRKPCWIEPLQTAPAATLITNDLTEAETTPTIQNNIENNPPMRKPIILTKISELITNASGIELESSDMATPYLELGLDSLILTQISLTCKREFKTPITFRQLNEDFYTPNLLADYLDKKLPETMFAPVATKMPAVETPTSNTKPVETNVGTINASLAGTQNTALNLIAQQLQILGKQIELMQTGANSQPSHNHEAYISAQDKNTNTTPISNCKSNVFKNEATPATQNTNILTEEEQNEHKKPFGASPRIDKQATNALQGAQESFLNNLIKSYNAKTIASKNYAQQHRSHMSDPRVVSGFKPSTKELVYPLVIKKSSGNKLWDLDGNEYIDALNGFGSCFFGHQPEFIKEALKNQIDNGFEVGPQHPLAGEVSQLLCEFTGHDRAALCNTGSEAVLGAMRIARTVTGRSLIVAFKGSYHGINDEGIVRGSKKQITFPAAAGIMPEAVKNMLILDYGTEESLAIIKERADELAAVLVEPIQSRRPEFRPIEFLKQLREITLQSETALIFDEVITGFRMHLGGMQAIFDIKADIATYGKVIGGGLSIGAILGKKEFMDALDGGFWQYGDDSFPEVGVTYFAGTFVRHPLALASCKAALLHMKEKGAELQNRLNSYTEAFANNLNLQFINRELPIQINYFGSLWRLNFTEDIPYSELLFVLLREKGIHIWDGFPCFLTEPYTQKDLDKISNAILESCNALVAAKILNPREEENNIKDKPTSKQLNTPPVSGAKLGRDEFGNPAWYIKEPVNGNYVKIDL